MKGKWKEEAEELEWQTTLKKPDVEPWTTDWKSFTGLPLLEGGRALHEMNFPASLAAEEWLLQHSAGPTAEKNFLPK